MHFSFLTITGSIVLMGWVVSPVQAQFPLLGDFKLQPSSFLNNDSNNKVVAECVRLDGRCVFKIAALKSELPGRLEPIEQKLTDISSKYLNDKSSKLQVEIQKEKDLPIIVVNVTDAKGKVTRTNLVALTQLDAKQAGVEEPSVLAEQLQKSLEKDLIRARLERQPRSLSTNGAIAAGIGIGLFLLSWGIRRRQNHLRQLRRQLASSEIVETQTISTQLTQRQQWNLQEAQYRLLQLAQGAIWLGGGLVILGLFPYTRILQVWILIGLQFPLRLGIVALGTYVVIRLSYSLIDRFTSALAESTLLTTDEDSQRLKLRVSTISGVTKSISTISCVVIGILVGLSTIGINIVPLLAGAGLVGVAISLASQSLIKDAINGFLIILEDQYAIGDFINVGGTNEGLVENLNLRITQLRDAQGRLITIPNSEIKIVANLSSNWSRADLTIPVHYHADFDEALNLINTVAQEMCNDPQWRKKILDTPQVLGVDNFGDQSMIVRVWIKTKPLKQWEVAREFRRRLKMAFDQAGIPIALPALPQPEIAINQSLPMKSLQDGQSLPQNSTKVL
ncbi:MAG TPA: mechanosensitive ion channel family protein [Coleofasciculaceae cyanobacterium]|jgi:small conductance mechanosensitive channel